MRSRTPKRAKVELEARKLEAVFLEDMNHICIICGAASAGVHHMIAGPNRGRALLVRASWLPLCWPCNSDKAEDKKTWPIHRQLALKFMCDPMFFDLYEINKLLAPKECRSIPQAVDPEDVLPWIVSEARAVWMRDRGAAWIRDRGLDPEQELFPEMIYKG